MSNRQIRCAALALALCATLASFQGVSSLAAPEHADPRLARLLTPQPAALQLATSAR